jgi:hypothetical protein
MRSRNFTIIVNDLMEKMPPIDGAKYHNATDKKCPRCEAHLDLYSLHRMKFLACPNGHGLWLFKDELRQLKNNFDVGQLHWLNAEIDSLEKTSATATTAACPTADGGQLLSVRFGKSSVIIDWCPKCHGLWLDRGEFDKVVAYLINELGGSSVKDVEKEIARDLKNLWKGEGPESRVAEIGDIAAATTALINFSIFDHPALFKQLRDVQAAGRGLGMD